MLWGARISASSASMVRCSRAVACRTQSTGGILPSILALRQVVPRDTGHVARRSLRESPAFRRGECQDEPRHRRCGRPRCRLIPSRASEGSGAARPRPSRRAPQLGDGPSGTRTSDPPDPHGRRASWARGLHPSARRRGRRKPSARGRRRPQPDRTAGILRMGGASTGGATRPAGSIPRPSRHMMLLKYNYKMFYV
jgi:hypothetical protein